ncbi:MAG: DUF2493 domain-containing protein [Gammaproteobacteria bacterium]|nr:DUF2493 domain-containing protein [Gammaproteobacteria bacterium]
MKLAIIGSRSFNNYDLLKSTLNDNFNNITCIISGGAKGADSLAEKYAFENNIATIIFKPDWKKYGRGAGIIRNKDIISNSDAAIAFWDGESKGTLNSINLCEKEQTPITVVKY